MTHGAGQPAMGRLKGCRTELGESTDPVVHIRAGGSYDLSPLMFERIQSLRRVVYNSQDYQEGIRAFLEKRVPKFLGK